MSARCPFCEAVHPIPAPAEAIGRTLRCLCGATALLCSPGQEPGTAVWLAELGLSDSYADVLDETVSVVWAQEWSRRRRTQ